MFNKQILFVVHFDEEAENRSERTETGSLLQFKILPIKKLFRFIQHMWLFESQILRLAIFPEMLTQQSCLVKYFH